MFRRLLSRSLAALAVCAAASAAASAQDFQRSYTLAPGATVSIKNVSGDVNVTGYEGAAVTVAAYKEGRDRELVEVEDRSTPNGVSLAAKYPERCNCDASVRFEVRVPRSLSLVYDKISTASGNLSARGVTGTIRLATASGDVAVEQVSGRVEASSASGNVRVREASGSVSASSASGDVEADLTRIEGAEDMKFSSASGDVRVTAPSNLDAAVSLSTATGNVETNFPLEVKRNEYGPGMSAKGRLGAGARTLRVSSASGSVSLKSM
jgi:DUF4097 and DUF4098 domain-containing protein YvlB